jgi:long-subunit fatty acid transport protein
MRKLIVVTSMVCLAAPAFAGGYFRPGVGNGALAQGGVGVAGGDDAYAAWFNPARLALIKKRQLLLDWTGIDEDLGFERSRNGLLPSERAEYDDGTLEFYLQQNCCITQTGMAFDQAPVRHIPFISVAHPLGGGMVVGLSVYGPHGPRRMFEADGAQRYAVVQTDILLAITQLTLAYGQKNFAFGLGLTNFSLQATQVFTVSADLIGTENPGFDASAAVAVRDDFIPVLSAGLWGRWPATDTRFGFSVQAPAGKTCAGEGVNRTCTNVDARGTIGVTLADGIAALGIGIEGDKGALRMNFPATYKVGVAQPIGDHELALEYVQERWSTIGNLVFVPEGITITGFGPEPTVLENIVFPRRWQDTHSLRFGGRYKLPKLPYLGARADLQLGALYETPATPLQEIDPSALDWEKIAFTGGLVLPVNEDLSFNMMYLHTLRSEFTVDQSALRTTNILHDDQMKKEPDLAKGGLQTVSGNGNYRIDHRRFGVGMKVLY